MSDVNKLNINGEEYDIADAQARAAVAAMQEQFPKLADKETQDRIARAVGADLEHKILGLRINKKDSNPATRCTYLGDAVGMTPAKMNFATGKFDYGSWGGIWFVKDNFPCLLGKDGTVVAKLNPNDYTKKEDGTTAGITATDIGDNNVMSAIPLVWIWQYEEGDFEYIWVSDYQVNENYHAYAHTRDDGTIRQYLFLSTYNGVTLTGADTVLRSVSGIQPMHSKTAENEIAYAKANGANWFTKTWSQRNLLQCLMKLMFCNTNSQACLGNGNLNYLSGDAAQNYGKCVTGTLNDKGQFWGADDNTHQVKAFHIEGVWANIWDRVAGLVNDRGTIRAKMTGPYPTTALTTSATFKDFDVVGNVTPGGTSGGFISETIMTRFGQIPYIASGSETTNECDGLWFNNGQLNYAHVGGAVSVGARCGLSCLALSLAASYAHWNVGASLSWL